MVKNKSLKIVAVVMGSDSDLPVMVEALDFLDDHHVEYDVQVLSAHRTPDVTASYAKNAAKKGIKVIIAAAGGAAHLPGVIAAHTHLPVIGVPIKTSTLSGVDSLYSIVQMPPGVPTATVGINAAKNAAILTLQILGVGDKKIANSVREFKSKLANSVLRKNQALQKAGVKNYLENKQKK